MRRRSRHWDAARSCGISMYAARVESNALRQAWCSPSGRFAATRSSSAATTKRLTRSPYSWLESSRAASSPGFALARKPQALEAPDDERAGSLRLLDELEVRPQLA